MDVSNHSFVICAYKENPYLEETILSLKNQTIQSKIFLSTSTPNEYIKKICAKHSIEVLVNTLPINAGADWNYAYDSVPTDLVTIVHQDDYYEPNFLEETLKGLEKSKRPIMLFTDYYEFKLGKKEESNTLLRIKRIMNYLLSKKSFYGSKFIRRRCLSIGCSICCPSVTFDKRYAGSTIFDINYINSCDYKTWTDLAEKDGDFIYLRKKLVAHRIYAESATSKNLSENLRKKEDLEILKRYWPAFIARLINALYANSEKSNKV